MLKDNLNFKILKNQKINDFAINLKSSENKLIRMYENYLKTLLNFREEKK